MRVRKVISRRIRRNEDGVQLAADVNAVIAGNVGERSARTKVSSRQRSVTRSGRRRSGRTGSEKGKPGADRSE